MSSVWRIGTEVVNCTGVNIGTARTDSATAEIIAESTSIVDGDWVLLKCDLVPVLYGRATVSATIDGPADRQSVTIRGPWEMLESIIYQQSTKVQIPHAVDEEHPYGYALGSVLSPDVTLGMDDDGDARNTLQEAQSIMNYAASAGVPVTFDPSFTGLPMRPVDINGSSCAACLLNVLRMHPDVVLYFDYSSGSGAALMAVKASGMAPITYPGISGSVVIDADFKRKLNYKPAGVRIVYQRTSMEGRLEVHEDSAGVTGSQGKAPNVINWLVNLEGVKPPVVQSQAIRTRDIPHTDDAEHDDDELKMNWWQTKLNWLNLAGVAELVTIDRHKVTVDPPNVKPSEDPDDGISDTWSTDPEDYPRELIDGTITDWMQKDAAPLTVSARFTIATPLPSGMSEEIRDELRAVFGRRTVLTRYSNVTGTDANTRVYYAPSFYPAPPDWPAGGVAAAYMDSFEDEVWGGSMTLTGDSQPIVALGGKVNVAGFFGAWASMGAVIQEVNYSPRDHSTRVICSAPDNFGVGDFYELQRTIKKIAGVDERAAADKKTQGVQNSGGKVKGAGFTANRATATNDSGGAGGDLVPWQCEREADFKLKVWPAAMFDGVGNNFWPTIGLVTTEAETGYTFEFDEDEGDGALYVECTVDDSNDVHGVITAAKLILDFDEHEYNKKEAGKVKILICQIDSKEESFSFLPVRSFVLCLRRFGPPGSEDWDVTAM